METTLHPMEVSKKAFKKGEGGNITTTPSKTDMKFNGKDVYCVKIATNDVMIPVDEWENLKEYEGEIDYEFFLDARGFYKNPTSEQYESFPISVRPVITATEETYYTIIQGISAHEFYCEFVILYYTMKEE